LKTSDFDYLLPPDHIAQEPLEPRDSSRLLVLDRRSGQRTHAVFKELPQYLQANDLLVINRSRVVPARISAHKIPGGGKVELLLLERKNAQTWKALVGGKGLNSGRQLQLPNGLVATVAEVLDGAQRLISFSDSIDGKLAELGQVPLPPYIHQSLANPDRYQTVYAEKPGSAAAPTAGLHFTEELMAAIRAMGVIFAEVVLHIGLDTFAPVNEGDPLEHKIHTEWCQLNDETASLINAARQQGGRVIAVGTTSVRTLESAAKEDGTVSSFQGRTGLFITPGYTFKAVDAMITNFHLPRSTLLMLVSAFAGQTLVMETYRRAILEGYRFYSFGDAMLIK
jgi:S-adenosylmethionine:tRNA ribosyltransferase-isomerase